MSQKRSNVVYVAVHSMNGEPITKANMKALEALQLQAQNIVANSGGQRLVLNISKD